MGFYAAVGLSAATDFFTVIGRSITGLYAATCHYVATSLSTASSFMETARESHPCELKMIRHL